MRIHFAGIGGIGVSALAQYYLAKGHEISGSDLAQSELTDFLAGKGINILIGNSADHVKSGLDMVIYSPAVKQDNPEFKQAQLLGIKLKSYPEALGELTHQYTTIAISGSHGKSTTTAMTALVLIKAGIDPTVIVGTKLKEFSRERDPGTREATNFRMGHSKYLVIEACEYDGSFLNYQPHIAVVTNADKEHLDYFGTFANVIKTFKGFVKKIPTDGWLIYNKDDKKIPTIKNSIGYSLRQKDAPRLKRILKVPGQHNVSNALAALAVARLLGVKDTVAFKALSEFNGTWRRFEMKKGSAGKKNITVVSDYGHHPTEIMATLKAAREKFPKKKIWCIFQPHQHQRTHYLFSDFVKLFKKIPIDQVIITDIYDVAGREEKNINEKVDSQLLVKKIGKKNVQYMPITQAEKFVKENIKGGEVLVIMGAGDVYKIADNF